jgi:hypothetical protein
LYAITLDKVMNGVMVVTTTTLPYMPLSGVVAGAPELYSCSLKPKSVIATVAPSASPSASPNSVSMPIPSPTIPSVPTGAGRQPCGLFGLSIFCFGPGECGLFRRMLSSLLGIGDC